MKTTFVIIIISFLPLVSKGQSRDTADVVMRGLVGTWIDTSNANHVIIFNPNKKMVEKHYGAKPESVTFNYSVQYKYIDRNTPGVRLNAKEDYDTTKITLAIYAFSCQIEFYKDRFKMDNEDGPRVFKRKR